ncbi:PAQR family membrane homeostasis protein TrhA [Haloplasma contractile]|uniref:Hemolysin III protein n=1 Tax=Haloplasma contractile SSD-17B TaxID=1033810 RepID=U2DT23_9MOLU|nr:hemolysin III family protein [Haloplasma contractile]ERJ11642.1 Hemolysin III protein [Haloplasma contractile SSD-17B]
MNKYFREPISSLTHLIGALLSLIGLIMMLMINIRYETTDFTRLFSIIVFGMSLILLYLTSGIYHMKQSESPRVIERLRKLDHSMIFVLIAGTYTPFCLLGLDGGWRVSFISIIWALAIVGIFLKLFYLNMPRFLSAGMYVVMGWLAIIAIFPLSKSLSEQGVRWLIYGGMAYTIGGVIYAIKKPNISKLFGFHELFHIFVMIGSLIHYLTILNYIIRT